VSLLRHVLAQGPVVWSVIGAALPGRAAAPTRAVVPPRSPALVDDFVRHVGGDPGRYAAHLPPTLFPQWGFPVLVAALRGAPYPLRRALNGGCRLEIRAPLPRDAPLTVAAERLDVDDDGRRAVLPVRLVTGTASAPDALAATVYFVVPLRRGGPARERPSVPVDAVERARWSLRPRDGRAFAALTGDVNPIHWLTPYARAAGFPSTLLHGFDAFARAVEALPADLSVLDVRFVRPIALPAEMALFTREGALWIGPAAGGPAHVTGTWSTASGGPAGPPARSGSSSAGG
jgi:MaoC like domain